MNRLKMCMVAVLGWVKAYSPAGEPMLEVKEPTGGYPVTNRHTGKAKERREAKRRRRAKGRK